ncbi:MULTISPECIES: translation elongation factor Ts [Thermodesulfobacterium]|jgi:elongation factor Ts|uniref:Elongation factor Ts n=1 Tax=Thermodesulfobacterium commune DSM 2178 TaxID=289377 RepID=A0A075WQJ3_9BACT|nr:MULTISPECIES: translation elongation factor Ts [Thermodesulfobacterium]AIH03579.1 elongation factor Ts [Thermodesulfobacterium commune DSM 2178]MDK2862096.1 elongation factor Ts [Thermodesulfobacterium sp.]MDN5378950.1 elongation factor Ts [Thermodesulfobacterium sp.]
MAQISIDLIKQLRERTAAGFSDCKKALEEAGGDIEKAIDILRKKGLAIAAKRAGKATTEGVVAAYIHSNKKIGVLVEVNCETDFVARTEEFQQFAHDIAMQIAATNPIAVTREEVPQEVIEREKKIYEEQVRESGKPENVIPKIVEGKMEKFYKENVLLEQAFIKNPEITIQDLLNELIAKTGEKIVIKRFARFQIGE